MKKALLLCASHNDLGLIWALRKLGYYIIATGNMPGLVGERFVDEYIQADYSDKDLILKIASDKKVDRICQCCNDFGVYTAAYVAEKLGFPGYDSYETTLILHNKDKFKKFAREYNICSPVSAAFEEEETACHYVQTVDYPIIVKPTDCSAGNGIHKAENEKEAIWAVKQAFAESRARRIVIEPYITGTQHGFCTFLHKQKVVGYCSNNEYSFLNPYRVEIDTFPADNDKEAAPFLIREIEKIAKILSLHDGIFHLQYIMDQNHVPQIIEVMRRTIGNMYWYPASLLNGFDWNYWETRARCGLSCEGFPLTCSQEGFFAYKTILSSQNGVFEKVVLPRQYSKYLLKTILLKKKGDKITHYETEPVGFLFFSFSTADEMRRILIDEYDSSLVKLQMD